MSIKLNASIIFIIFLILKLTNVIMWSWWIIFLPLIIPAIIYLILIVFVIQQVIRMKDPNLYKELNKKIFKKWKR